MCCKNKNNIQFTTVLFVMLIIIECGFLSGCSQKKTLYCGKIVEEVLWSYGFCNDVVYSIADPFHIEVDNEELKVEDSELHMYLCNPEDYATKISCDHKDVRKGDYIKARLDVETDGSHFVDTIIVHVGSRLFDPFFEEHIIGAFLNESIDVSWYPETEDICIGNTVYPADSQIKMTVEEIYDLHIPELDDAFVRKYLGMESLEKYYDSVRNDIILGKMEAQKEKNIEKVFDEIAEKSDIRLDRNDILSYGSLLFLEYDKMASYCNMSFEEYYSKQYGCDKEVAYECLYKESEKKLKEMALVGVLAERYSIFVSEPCTNEQGTEIVFSEEKQKYEYMYGLLREKVYNYIVDNW